MTVRVSFVLLFREFAPQRRPVRVALAIVRIVVVSILI